MGILLFILGAFAGAFIQLLIEHPFEELIEKRFQQLLHTGIYRKFYFLTVDYKTLQEKLQDAVSEFNFDYAKILLKQMEWFVEEKTNKEKQEAKEIAQKDYENDLNKIKNLKGDSKPQHYLESENKWEKDK